MTIVILATILAAIVGISVLIIGQLQLSRNVNHAILAYYSAETGIERSLFDIKQARNTGENIQTTINSLKHPSGPDTRLRNGATWDTFDDPPTQAFSDFFVSRIDRDKSVKFNLFNPDDFSENSGAIVDVHLSWDFPPDPDLQTAIELTIVEINSQANEVCDSVTKQIVKYPVTGIELNGIDVMECGVPSTEDVFQVRAKALFDDILNFELIAYDGDGEVIDQIESGISLKSVGQFSRSQQAVMIEVPWKLTATGLLDYVIFSEEYLEKYRET